MIDVVLIIMYLMMAVAIAALVFSVVRSMRLGGRTLSVVNGIPSGKIILGTVAGVAVVMAVAFLTGSGDVLSINGKEYSQWFWLKAADMFINTSLLLLAVAAVLVVYGIFRRRGHVQK